MKRPARASASAGRSNLSRRNLMLERTSSSPGLKPGAESRRLTSEVEIEFHREPAAGVTGGQGIHGAGSNDGAHRRAVHLRNPARLGDLHAVDRAVAQDVESHVDAWRTHQIGTHRRDQPVVADAIAQRRHVPGVAIAETRLGKADAEVAAAW